MRITETAHWIGGQNWADPPFQQRFEVKQGELHIPDRPGASLERNEESVTRHLAEF